MEEREVKVVLLGQSSVGKTCMVYKLISGYFDESATPTLGASYSLKILEVDKIEVSLQIWDTAGQERFRVLTPMYYRGAQAALLVYSITDELTFEEIDFWANSIKENNCDDVLLFLVGNKIDLHKDRKVSEESGRAKAEKIGAEFFETSAKTGDGIDELFLNIAKICIEKQDKAMKYTQSQSSSSRYYLNNDSQKKSCC